MSLIRHPTYYETVMSSGLTAYQEDLVGVREGVMPHTCDEDECRNEFDGYYFSLMDSEFPKQVKLFCSLHCIKVWCVKKAME